MTASDSEQASREMIPVRFRRRWLGREIGRVEVRYGGPGGLLAIEHSGDLRTVRVSGSAEGWIDRYPLKNPGGGEIGGRAIEVSQAYPSSTIDRHKRKVEAAVGESDLWLAVTEGRGLVLRDPTGSIAATAARRRFLVRADVQPAEAGLIVLLYVSGWMGAAALQS